MELVNPNRDPDHPAAMRIARRAYTASPWLVSAVGHLVSLLVLLLVAMPAGSRRVGPLIVTMDTHVDHPRTRFSLAAEEITIPSERPIDPLRVPTALDLVHDAKPAEVLDPRISDVTAMRIVHPLDTRIGGGSGKKGDALFFGTSASGRDFVFILDCSGSMIARDGARFARARDELVESISRLRPDQRFYVFLFNWSTIPMFGHGSDPGGLVPATPENVAGLRSWLYGIHPTSGTDPRRSLVTSFAMNPDAIFLLSDGQFNTPQYSNQAMGWDASSISVFDIIAHKNPSRVRVNAIAFEDVVAAKGMSRLAEETGGQFRFIPTPGQEDVAIEPDPLPPLSTGRQQTREERLRIARAVLLIRRAERLVERDQTDHARALVQDLETDHLPPEVRKRLDAIRF